MKKTILKISLLNLCAAALLALPAAGRAQEATPPGTPAAPEHKSDAPVKHKKHDHSVFNGKLGAIDAKAMTLTVGERTFEITSETKITKDGRPATLADGVVGEPVGGAYKKTDGKLVATSVHFGGKSEPGKSDGGKSDGEKKHKKKSGPDAGGGTNSVPN